MHNLISSVNILLALALSITMLYGFHKCMSRRRGSGDILLSNSVSKAWSEQIRRIANVSWAVNHPSYDILQNSLIKEYDLKATLYRHKKSGAEVISVLADDDNKVFGINFVTPPSDSMGLPHILEHSVLCGSRLYPVKEPFADLLKGSLQNFLNAFTYPDRTCYPVASTNTKDFYNLVNVYLDSVLHPRALKDRMVLQQEGWHYELDNPSDNLTIKGVVYNEMKGVYSQPSALMYRATQQNLFPDTTYGVDSGGDPDVIPSLNFKQFTDFHSQFYHPSNSKVFFYGNDDPSKRLSLLDEYLREFDGVTAKTSETKILYQSKFKSPRRHKVLFPLDPNAEVKHMISVNWVLNEKPLDMKTTLTLSVLDSLLTGSVSSSLRKTLTESNLGESLLGGGYSDDLRQSTYSVGMKGVLPENVPAVEDLILKSLQNLSTTGFDDDAIESAINTLEFRLREFTNGGGSPKGLGIMLAMLPSWMYGSDPFDSVRFEESLASLKKDIADKKPIFQDLIVKYLLQNTHRLTVEAVPDVELEKRTETAEINRLSKIKESLSAEAIDDIVKSTALLKEAQLREDSPEDKATIPRLSLSDIDPKHTDPIKPIIETISGNATVLKHPIQTNGIIYANVVFDYSKLSFEELLYLPLFNALTTQAGTSTFDEVKLNRRIGASTGGISMGTQQEIKFQKTIANGDDFILKLIMSGKAVGDKAEIMVDLMQDMLLNTNFDNQRRAVELLRASKASMQSSLTSSGHSLASMRISAKYTFLAYQREQLSGLTGIRRSSEMLHRAKNNWAEVLEILKNIHKNVITKDTVMINLTGDENVINSSLGFFQKFVSNLPESVCGATGGSGENSSLTLQDRWRLEKSKLLLPLGKNEGFSIPSQVNYVVKGGQLLSEGDATSGHYDVLAKFLSTGYLWDNVRVVGGAYGGSASFGGAVGRLTFSSYRDPNLIKTIEAFDQSPSAFALDQISPEKITEVIIGSIGDLDAPMSADQKGYSSFIAYLTGESEADRQEYRNQVLSTNSSHASEFAGKLKDMLENRSSVVVFGSETALNQANEEMIAKTGKILFEIERAYVKEKEDDKDNKDDKDDTDSRSSTAAAQSA